MEFIKISERTNKLLNKQEIKAEVVFDGPTPSRALIKKEFSKKNKLDPAKTILKKIFNVFGEKKIIITIDVYKDIKSLQNSNKVYIKREEKLKKQQEQKAEETKVEKADAEEIKAEETKTEESEVKESKTEDKKVEEKPQVKPDE